MSEPLENLLLINIIYGGVPKGCGPDGKHLININPQKELL
jgi:hypothetical protein